MWVLLSNHSGDLLSGTLMSLRLTGIGFSCALVLGVVLATCRISPIPPLRFVGFLYVEIFRNIPIMSLIVLLLFALPGIRLSFITAVSAALALVGGSFVCEALRSGINSIDKGQVEAARSIGLGFTGVLSQVVFPLAFRAMVQPLVTIAIAIFLSSSMAAIVGVADLTKVTNSINNEEALGLIAFICAAIIYVIISLGIAWVGSQIERRVRLVR